MLLNWPGYAAKDDKFYMQGTESAASNWINIWNDTDFAASLMWKTNNTMKETATRWEIGDSPSNFFSALLPDGYIPGSWTDVTGETEYVTDFGTKTITYQELLGIYFGRIDENLPPATMWPYIYGVELKDPDDPASKERYFQ